MHICIFIFLFPLFPPSINLSDSSQDWPFRAPTALPQGRGETGEAAGEDVPALAVLPASSFLPATPASSSFLPATPDGQLNRVAAGSRSNNDGNDGNTPIAFIAIAILFVDWVSHCCCFYVSVTLLLSHLATWSLCYSVALSLCHSVIQPFGHSVTLSLSHFVT